MAEGLGLLNFEVNRGTILIILFGQRGLKMAEGFALLDIEVYSYYLDSEG